MTSATPAPGASISLWSEWGRVTRFLESARLAFARERNLWTSLEIAKPSEVELVAPRGVEGVYQVALDAHLAALDDEETLLASVLIHSYALAEFAAMTSLVLDSRTAGGIEVWGKALLSSRGNDWSDVLDGEVGAVEVVVVRDSYAHGARILDTKGRTRLTTAGALSPPAVGSTLTLSYDNLRQYRDRLKSLLRCGGFNVPENQR